MTFQVEQKVKSQVVEAIGTDQLFRLLSDPDANIVMKTLGLLRNLLSQKKVSTFTFLAGLVSKKKSSSCDR